MVSRHNYLASGGRAIVESFLTCVHSLCNVFCNINATEILYEDNRFFRCKFNGCDFHREKTPRISLSYLVSVGPNRTVCFTLIFEELCLFSFNIS